jgi:hypothetical protein
MGHDLRSLAETYVRLETELEDVRRAMLAALTNGAAPANPTPRSGSKPGSDRFREAAEAEDRIVTLLRNQPGLKTAEIAKETAGKLNTVTERLKRLRTKGMVTGGGSDGWSVATATP